MFGNCDPADVGLCDQRACHSRGVCAYSRRNHVELEGRAMTSKAQTCPARLSQLLAQILCAKAGHQRCQDYSINSWARILGATWNQATFSGVYTFQPSLLYRVCVGQLVKTVVDSMRHKLI